MRLKKIPLKLEYVLHPNEDYQPHTKKWQEHAQHSEGLCWKREAESIAFFLKSSTGHFRGACLIWISNHRWYFSFWHLILLRRFVILRSKATKNLDLVWRSSEILRSLRSLRMTRRMICRSSINFRFNTFNSSQSKFLVGQAKFGESVYQANFKPIDRIFLDEVFRLPLKMLFLRNLSSTWSGSRNPGFPPFSSFPCLHAEVQAFRYAGVETGIQ